MAKILCMTTGLTGILHASFEVVSRLKKAGHEVIYACPWDVEEKVTKQGFDYLQLSPVNFDPAPALPEFRGRSRTLKRLGIRLMKVKERRSEAVKALGMDKFSAVLDQIKPDLILIDLELHDHILTAVSKNIPTALLNQFFSLWKRPNLPPIFSDIIPREGWRGHRLGIEWSWLKARFRQKLYLWKTRSYTVFTDRASILRCYAGQIGFPAGEITEQSEFPSPLTYRTLPVISLTARELEFPHPPRPGVFYAGPMVYLDRKDSKTDPETNNQLDQIFKAKKKKMAKLIYCSVSTMQKGVEKILSDPAYKVRVDNICFKLSQQKNELVKIVGKLLEKTQNSNELTPFVSTNKN